MNKHRYSLDSSALLAVLGRVLSGRFRLDTLIAEGCMGAVFSAWDLAREAPCAVKLLLPQVKDDPQASQRFADEARLLSRLCHPNIVEVLAHDQDPDGTLYLVMELLVGTNLDQVLRKHGRLSLAVTLSIIKQVGSALHTAHLAGIVHRDIKPANIILLGGDEHSCPQTAKVIDFGLAKIADQRKAPRRDSDGMFIGTPAYLPPEAWNRISAEVDARADQWGLAVITYLMLTGELPYVVEDIQYLRIPVARTPPPPISSLVDQIPEYIEIAVARALSPNKEERFATILDFVRALHNLSPASPFCSTISNPPMRSAQSTHILAPSHLLESTTQLSPGLQAETPLAPVNEPRRSATETVVSAADNTTPVLASLGATLPGMAADPRVTSLSHYIPAMLSILGALLAWGSVLWWWMWISPGSGPHTISASRKTSSAGVSSVLKP